MTDTGQIPGEGLPESAGMVEQPGGHAPGAYTGLTPSAASTPDDDLLLMPGAQGAWLEDGPHPQEPGDHERAGRDSTSVDMSARTPAVAHSAQARRPLHTGPSAAGPGTVRSLADRGPAVQPAPVTTPGPATGPEYLDFPREEPTVGDGMPQGAVPWTVQPAADVPEETVVPDLAGAPAAPAPYPEPAHHLPQDASAYQNAPVAGAESGQFAYAAAPQQAYAAGASDPRSQAEPQLPQGAGAFDAAPHVGAGPVGHLPAADLPGQEAAYGQPGVPEQPGTDGHPDAAYAGAGPAGLGPDALGQPYPQEGPAPSEAYGAEHAEGAVDPVGQGQEPIGRFVPVEGVVPTTPHLAPTPPHALRIPADAHQPAAEQPAAAQEPGAYVSAEYPGGEYASAEYVAGEQLAAEQGELAEAVSVPGGPEGGEAVAVEVAPVPDGAEVLGAAEVPGGAEVPGIGEVQGVEVAHQGAELGHGVAQVPAEQAELGESHAEAPVAPAPVLLPEGSFAGAQQLGEAGEVPAEAAPGEVAPGEFVAVESAAEFDLQAAASVTDTGAEEVAEPVSAEPAPVQLVPAQSAPVALPEASPAAPQSPEAAGQLEAAEVAEAPERQTIPGEHTAPGNPVLPEGTEAHGEHALQVVPHGVHIAPEAHVAPEVHVAPVDPADHHPADQPPPVPHQPADPEPAAPQPAERAPAAPAYADAEREAVLRVIRERRDIRNGFRDDPIPHEVLLRVLEAAHTAPSVGHSQPWDFVVIRSAETRRTMHELAMRQREVYAKSLPRGRAKQFKELKIEAILDTPVNIVVTADPTRGGRHTLGRHTQPQMAPYSSALAVENLWLAARAEGLGVGWVSFFDEREMVRALGLPEHLEVVAYLCVGYVDEFPEDPELMQAGWSKRRPLSWVVHEETYGRRALPGEEPHDLLAETVAGIRPLDAKALGAAWDRQKRMTKPAGALGVLEIISAQLSGLSRMCPPPVPEPAAVAIFAGDHGVHAQQVTPWPQEVTAQMVANFLAGGAVCNAFAAQVGAEVCVIDVGVAGDLPATPGLLPRKVRAGTADMTQGPALSREEVVAAVEVGIETARDLVSAGNKALLTGEMGIANTTASAALISVFTDTDPAEVTGRGTGVDDETLARKTEVVRRALALHQPDPADPIGVLAAVGGLEHAALVGLILGGASLRTPVILDGVSAGAAALVARALAPESLAACIAGHRSAEPGHLAALNKLGLRPLVDLDLRLGEGTGALLALPVVQSAARAVHEVATFDSAGVTEK